MNELKKGQQKMNGTLIIKKFWKKLWSVGMFLQKAMKQGRNVYGISSCDACSKIQ